MMRILVVLACSIVLAAIGFVLYWTMQSPDGRQALAAKAAKHPVTLPTAGEGFGPGEKVWWNRYDAKGERTSRIRVSRYKPLKDGRFFVTDPECDFFLANGQMLHIEGKTGNIVTQENLGKSRNSPAGAGQNRSPRIDPGQTHARTHAQKSQEDFRRRPGQRSHGHHETLPQRRNAGG